jgi:arginine N-succinyltransferase
VQSAANPEVPVAGARGRVLRAPVPGPRERAADAIVLRPAQVEDLRALSRLAGRLDTVNLPSDTDALAAMIRQSIRSFAGKVRRRADAVYVFVAEDPRKRRIAGASVIIAKHGTPDSPHYYLDVAEEERYSKTLRRLFRHTYLHLRRSFDGPTEVGGLIVDDAYRGDPDKIGKQLSYVRFLYMGLHTGRFETNVLAEMLPPLTPAGASPLWECYGRRVTGLSFHEAEVLSRGDKEFIDALFPQAPIYVCMLPEEVRDQIGVVGPQTAAALHVLEKIGFRFLRQIDPFDGGPYWGARLQDIALVGQLRQLRVQVAERTGGAVRVSLGRDGGGHEVLVGMESRRGFRAMRVRARVTGEEVLLAPEDARAFGVGAGARVAVTPFL